MSETEVVNCKHVDEEKKKRHIELGFCPQREVIWNRYLPYANKLDEESKQMLICIKKDLFKALMLRDIYGILISTSKLNKYFNLYGLKFSKDEHILLIKIYLELIAMDGLDPVILRSFCNMLLHLLSKPIVLGPNDMLVDWRPLYKLYILKTTAKGTFYQHSVNYKNGGRTTALNSLVQENIPFLSPIMLKVTLQNEDESGQNLLRSVISICSMYFSISGVQEIIDEVLPQLQPLDVGRSTEVFDILSIFLNYYRGYEIWFDDFMNLWNTYQNPFWNQHMMSIMGNLAFENIGKIDWEPHMAVMFTRILRWLDLPVTYKKLKVVRSRSNCVRSAAKWIIAVLGPNSSAQEHLRKMIGAIESYLHPANNGKWVKIIGQMILYLEEYFIDRLEFEMFRKCEWKDEILGSHKLTEKCISDFVVCLKPAAFQAMYSRVEFNDVSKIFKNLANLRPQLIIPEVLDRVFANLESLTEPHKLTASLNCLVGISRAAICSQDGYSAGRTHIIPILFAVLPGIDPNDLRKALLTINFYGAFIFQIPIIDCSKAGQFVNDLTEEEALICEQTSDFENFVLQLIDRLFIMIKYAARENIRMEQSNADNNKSGLDMLIESAISSVLKIILEQCSNEILMSAAKKVINLVQTNLLEPLLAAPLLGALVSSVAVTAGDYILKMLVPYLSDRIRTYVEDHKDIYDCEKQPDEFLYRLIIMNYLIKGDPREVIKYLDDYIIPILDELMKFKCKQTNRITSHIISCLMYNVSRVLILDTNSYAYLSSTNFSEHLPIRHWGSKMNPNDTFNWYIPGDDEFAVYKKLILRFLPPILEKFNKYVSGEIYLCREEILQNLNYISSLINTSNLLPNLDEPPLNIVDTVVDTNSFDILLGYTSKRIYLPDGSNIRLAIIDVIERVQTKLLETSPDDIQSLKVIISIWDRICVKKSYASSYEIDLKSYKYIKQFQDYKLLKKRHNIKAIAAKRVQIQQVCRDEYCTPPYLTKTHIRIINRLIELSTSNYSEIRIFAQSSLSNFFKNYMFSYRLVVENVAKLLELNSVENHEAFKGALYIIITCGKKKLIVKNDWYCIEKLWSKLLMSSPSEKPSIVRLIDGIMFFILEEFSKPTIELKMCDKIFELASKLNSNKREILSDDQIKNGHQNLIEYNKKNLEIYYNIINKIVEIAETKSLNWRYQLLATSMLYALGHPKTQLPANVAQYFVNNLIHESIKERKYATQSVVGILKQQKRKNVKINVDPFEIAGIEKPTNKLPFGPRKDNQWLQYDINTLPRTSEEWESTVFVHKPRGFFRWPSVFEVYAPSSQQPSIERKRHEMNKTEQIIYDFFIDKHNVEKLISFWSLEECKGRENFKERRFYLIKYLFKSFGDDFFENFHVHLKNLIINNKVESNHRCAAEILCGIMSGMKHWNFEKTNAIYNKIIPLIRLALENITVETNELWGTCFATASQNIDPKKQYWLHEVLLEDLVRECTSFSDCCRVFCLQGPFIQHVWRMDATAHRLLNYLRPYLSHNYQNMRRQLGSVLINIFEADIEFEGGNPPQCPRVKDMINEVIEKLQPLYNDAPIIQLKSDTGEEKIISQQDREYENAIKLLKTVFHWITGVISQGTHSSNKAFFDLLPLACRLESNEQDSELADTTIALIAVISQSLILPKNMGYALQKFDEISRSSSWGARLAIIDALQVFVFHNMTIVSSCEKWIVQVQEIVLRLLEDFSIEVREKAAQVLGGLLHCAFLSSTDKLLELFKQKSKTRLLRSSASIRPRADLCDFNVNGKPQENENLEILAIRARHTGILGLCAFISAHPYDIPEFVPDVFEHLGEHLNDPQPIPTTIRKTVGHFKRTHHDNWETHQLKFTEDQLAVLSDLSIPPCYYS